MSREYRWLFVAVAGIVLACTRIDIVEKDFSDAAALRAEGVVSRGWISDALPLKAQKIKLRTNVDTNEVWAKFVAPPDAVDAIMRSCPRVEIQTIDLPRTSAGIWWPDYLIATDFARERARFFRCADGGVFAASTSDTFVYFWRQPTK